MMADAGDRTGRFVLAATVLASAMAFIDGTVVMIALPVIQKDFGATFQDLQWILNAYTLMLGALILVAGALGDRVGRRRIFVIGIVIFALASLGCAIATSSFDHDRGARRCRESARHFWCRKASRSSPRRSRAKRAGARSASGPPPPRSRRRSGRRSADF